MYTQVWQQAAEVMTRARYQVKAWVRVHVANVQPDPCIRGQHSRGPVADITARHSTGRCHCSVPKHRHIVTAKTDDPEEVQCCMHLIMRLHIPAKRIPLHLESINAP